MRSAHGVLLTLGVRRDGDRIGILRTPKVKPSDCRIVGLAFLTNVSPTIARRSSVGLTNFGKY